jgi:hypothetical protein
VFCYAVNLNLFFSEPTADDEDDEMLIVPLTGAFTSPAEAMGMIRSMARAFTTCNQVDVFDAGDGGMEVRETLLIDSTMPPIIDDATASTAVH